MAKNRKLTQEQELRNNYFLYQIKYLSLKKSQMSLLLPSLFYVLLYYYYHCYFIRVVPNEEYRKNNVKLRVHSKASDINLNKKDILS